MKLWVLGDPNIKAVWSGPDCWDPSMVELQTDSLTSYTSSAILLHRIENKHNEDDHDRGIMWHNNLLWPKLLTCVFSNQLSCVLITNLHCCSQVSLIKDYQPDNICYTKLSVVQRHVLMIYSRYPHPNSQQYAPTVPPSLCYTLALWSGHRSALGADNPSPGPSCQYSLHSS